MGRWYFPESGGGETQGLNEPGVEMFKETDSLARETVQNVLDNADDLGSPRVVEFELLDLSFDDFPDITDFQNVFLACHGAMKKLVRDGTANEEKFFQQGIALLNAPQKTIPTLRIRDMNTTGLRGNDDEEDQPFCRLLRVQGVSSAQGVKGGTYGIGQRAPFHCSSIRTIIYYTRRRPDLKEVFIAKSILCTHSVPEAPKRKRQAKGWWCFPNQEDPDNWVSLREGAQMRPFFRREQTGTDLYVTGFVLYSAWEQVIRHAVLKNFFAAINRNELEVRLLERGQQRCSLTKETLEAELARAAEEQRNEDPERCRKELGAALAFLRALRSPVNGKPFAKTIKGIGSVELYVHRDPDDPELPDLWAYMRKPHMLVGTREAKVLRRFAGVLLCDNDEGNTFLSRLEGPQHREWKSTEWRNASPEEIKNAERVDRQIREFVRDSLKSLRAGAGVTELNPPNLGHYLPEDEIENAFDDTKEAGSFQSGKSTEKELAHRVTPVAVPLPVKGRKRKRRIPTLELQLDGPVGPTGGPGPLGGEGSGGSGGGAGGPGTEKRTGPGEGVPRRIIKPEEVDCRSFMSGDSCILVIKSAKNVEGDLRLVAVGESGHSPSLRILSARNENDEALAVSGGVIRSLVLKQGVGLRLRVDLDVGSRVCLGVGK